ncbi:hypothetical protein EZV73_01635 [Acidaminobacter sp. JC074]|uniref:hypothetical protein n=1 Tax=Acidaminobacter sp. JC074 TaxID=2530199 RepID=UPI001F118ACB|nr:hypothetical protein [Acidaminobacter sp. JC074]MCH4886246.1 hypothetical protein [Acidaminobacter sp. JC074]
MMRKLRIMMLLLLMIGLVSCNSENETIVFDDDVKEEIFLTEHEIVEKFELERYKLFSFKSPYDNYKALIDEYCLSLDSNEMKAYDVFFEGMDEEDLKGKFFVGLTVDESRERLIEIGADLKWLDTFITNYGNPKHNLYISEIIPGYYENESTVIVVQEVDIEAESLYDPSTWYRVRGYKFKKVEEKNMLVQISDSYGFTYLKEESNNDKSLEEMMAELEERIFVDGNANYVKTINLNEID